MGENVTDVTVEVFNHCLGSCTGCLLSTVERRAVAPVMQPRAFRTAMRALSDYGMHAGMTFRPVIVYGDVPWMPVPVQQAYYAAASDAGLPLGLTMTLVEEAREESYWRGIDAFLSSGTGHVFDVTVDPVRLLRDEGYARRICRAASLAPELHLQMLLSEALLTRASPEALAASVSGALEGRAVSLGFTPALSRMDASNFRYDVGGAASWARRFYDATPEGRELFEAETKRFQDAGSYGDFLAQTFHIGPDLSVYATGYTIFGDVVLDARNGGFPLGNVGEAPLTSILHGREARRMDALASGGMALGDFGCETCRHASACTFNGVGAVRRIYREHEHRTGSCHGPAAFESAA